MKITILKEKDMLDIFSMKDTMAAVSDAMKAYSEKRCNIPLWVNIDVPEHHGQSLYMPGYVSDLEALGMKIVSVYPGNVEKGLTAVPAMMALLNAETGEVCCIMDGTCLTRMRTGAVSGVATELLARKDARTMALLGTGGQAGTQLEAVLNVREIELVKVYGRNIEKAKAFAQRMQAKFQPVFGTVIEASLSSSEALNDADIVTSATTSKEPVYDGRLLKKGVHINSVGSYTPEMSEVDEYVVCNSRAYVDTREGVLHECGSFLKPIKNGAYDFKRVIGEIGELILEKVPGRTSEDEMTFFCSVGSAVQDVVVAKKIYDKAKALKAGTTIEL